MSDLSEAPSGRKKLLNKDKFVFNESDVVKVPPVRAHYSSVQVTKPSQQTIVTISSPGWSAVVDSSQSPLLALGRRAAVAPPSLSTTRC
jgi:hypothetical protein